MNKLALFTSMVLFSLPTFADNSLILQAAKDLKLTNPEIQPSPLPGFKLLLSSEGVFYISEKADFLIEGDVYSINKMGVSNLAHPIIGKKINETAQREGIRYLAPKEKYKVTVFTDTTCTYCKKLHQEIKSYTDNGITIQYLAYPRAGIDSPAGKQMQTIWCSNEKKQYALLDDAFAQKTIPSGEICEKNNVDINRHIALAKQIGIRGTPTIVLPNGEVVSGYVPAEALKAALDKVKK